MATLFIFIGKRNITKTRNANICIQPESGAAEGKTGLYILKIFLNNFLQVTRTQAGNYTCHASNVEGDAESKPVTLTIMCKSCFDLLFKSRLLRKIREVFILTHFFTQSKIYNLNPFV